MRSAVLGGAGATATALGASATRAGAAEVDDTHPITIPKEFEQAKNATLPDVDFPMSGAQVFARACKEEGVKALFCCPGNYDVVHAIADTGIPTYGGRHEGSLCHAADAFTSSHRRGRGGLGDRGPRVHRHDLRRRGRQRGALAGAGAGQQQVGVCRGHRAGHPGRLSAADDRGHAEVRQAAHHPGPGLGVRRLRVPSAEERRAQAGASRLPGRDRPGAIPGPERARVLLRQDEVPHRHQVPHPDPTAIDAAVDMLRSARSGR